MYQNWSSFHFVNQILSACFSPWKPAKSRILYQNCRNFQYCPNLPNLPRQLKTHIVFSVFPILGTNLWQHHNSAVQGAYWALMQCSIVILRWSSPLLPKTWCLIFSSLKLFLLLWQKLKWQKNIHLQKWKKKMLLDQENVLPFELPLAMFISYYMIW